MDTRIKKSIATALLSLLVLPVFAQTQTFEYTGDVQTYTVPVGVYQLEVDLYGASGGWNDYNGVKYDKYLPGKGGYVHAILPVHPGQTLYIYVGGMGGNGSYGVGGAAGYNGGGIGNTSTIYSGGGGGGATDIRINGKDLNDRVLVAGGGGGAAYNYADGGDNGGNGGDLTAQDGFSNHLQEDESRGRGGDQYKGGLGGQWNGYEKASDGTFGAGGNGPAGTAGTGGGGGYYGGGGGCWAGGGGGSSYAISSCTKIQHQQGAHEGNGRVIIKSGFQSYFDDCINPIVRTSVPTTLCEGEQIILSATSNSGGAMFWDNEVINHTAFTPPVGKTTYTVTSTSKKDCPYSIELNVIGSQIKATTTNGIICEGETTTLIGYGGENFTWDQGVQNNVPFTPPVGVNSYTVHSYDPGNTKQCANKASVFVVVNRVSVIGDVKTGSGNEGGQINITPTGGTYPYSFQWTKDGQEISRYEDLTGLSAGTYDVLIVDAIGCSTTASYSVSGTISTSKQQGLHAEMNSDQRYLSVSYPGLFDYKIINERGEIMITGSVNNSGQVDVSRLPSGSYRICSLYNNSTENINFVKW